MEPFLRKLAKQIYSEHPDGFLRVCLVFPNRRAALFMQHYLSGMIEKPVWLPDMFSLEDFVMRVSGLTLADPLHLVAQLYKVYKLLENEKAQPFSSFISWGNMLLADFDEIDQYQANGVAVFNYLNEAKALEKWNPDGTPLTQFEQDYLHFYNSLSNCYQQFRETLLRDKQAYFGLAFDKLLQDISPAAFAEWDKIIFAGFNALTPSEEKLIKKLQEIGKADIYWDVDAYYLTRTEQEAGRFLRNYHKNNTFGALNWIGNDLVSTSKQVDVMGVSGNVGQAKLAGEICKSYIEKQGNADGLAIVLVDEGMLLPVLNSIPAECSDFNVTMGYSFKLTPAFSFMDAVISLLVRAQQMPNTNKPSAKAAKIQFYGRHIQRFLLHPFVVNSSYFSSKNEKPALKLPDKPFYSVFQFIDLLKQSHKSIARIFEKYLKETGFGAIEVIDILGELIGWMHEIMLVENENTSGRKTNSIEQEYLFQAARISMRLKELSVDTELGISLKILPKVFAGLAASIRLPFYGEPLQGLQVMGMLETRLLDFGHIIMVGANEGMLPKGKRHSTFIPDEVRMNFALQRHTERNAVFAYHFYRLMQRAEKAWLIYNSEGDALGGGEKSRFITQMQYELPRVNPNFNITERSITVSPEQSVTNELAVRKTPQIMARLQQISETGISPTALTRFLECGLRFYYANVLRISEPDEINETMDAAQLGDIIHEALYNIYFPYINRYIQQADFAQMLGQVEGKVREAFLKRFSDDDFSTGRNLLMYRIALQVVKKMVEGDKQMLEEIGLPLQIQLLEEEMQTTLEFHDFETQKPFQVKIKGKVDRVDKVGGVARIIDYKTGKFEEKDLKIKNISDVFGEKPSAKLIQVLMYALMYARENDTGVQMESGIMSVRGAKPYCHAMVADSHLLDQTVLNDFANELAQVISGIFNQDEWFVPTDKLETCKLCPFQVLCNRVAETV